MAIFQKKHEPTETEKEEIRVQDFFDRITPSTIKFYPDRYLCGAAYHCVWAIREYPPTAEEQALLAHLGDQHSAFTTALWTVTSSGRSFSTLHGKTA